MHPVLPRGLLSAACEAQIVPINMSEFTSHDTTERRCLYLHTFFCNACPKDIIFILGAEDSQFVLQSPLKHMGDGGEILAIMLILTVATGAEPVASSESDMHKNPLLSQVNASHHF